MIFWVQEGGRDHGVVRRGNWIVHRLNWRKMQRLFSAFVNMLLEVVYKFIEFVLSFSLLVCIVSLNLIFKISDIFRYSFDCLRFVLFILGIFQFSMLDVQGLMIQMGEHLVLFKKSLVEGLKRIDSSVASLTEIGVVLIEISLRRQSVVFVVVVIPFFYIELSHQ